MLTVLKRGEIKQYFLPATVFFVADSFEKVGTGTDYHKPLHTLTAHGPRD